MCCGTVELARALPSESACGIIAVWKLLLSSAPHRLGTHCIVSTSVALPVACGLGTFGHSRMLLPAHGIGGIERGVCDLSSGLYI